MAAECSDTRLPRVSATFGFAPSDYQRGSGSASPPAPRHADPSPPGRYRRRFRGPGPPDALVPPVLRGHRRRLPAGRLLTVDPSRRRPPMTLAARPAGGVELAILALRASRSSAWLLIRSGMDTPVFRRGDTRFTSPESRPYSIVCSMSGYRLGSHARPGAVLRDHCGHARYMWTSPSSSTPTGTRAARAPPATWSSAAAHPGPAGTGLAAGSQTVQQQALRDFARAMTAF